MIHFRSLALELSKAAFETKFYKKILKCQGIWKHLTSPLYILVVLYLSVLLMPSIFLAVTWYPWVYYITNEDVELSKLIRRYFLLSNNSYSYY